MPNSRHHHPAIGWPRALLAALLLVGCIWFIWSNSALPPEDSARRSQMVADFLARVLGGVLGSGNRLVRFVQENVRKIAHAAEFFVLGAASVLMLGMLRRITGHMLLHAAFMLLCVAVTDEAIQIFYRRGAMVQDILLDFAGGMAGLLLALTLYYLFTGALRRALRQ